ncbi:hypothetical protein DV515_00016608 [Chloebia gouldiae]|uniref:Keratin n=1 Tax=Chloebia gouldiae TaxID=44316 RepID=A0A3L8RSB6_CHLGU|nr:hypothetical protein DV515_00016608 [Chloebia gouldiae]
MSPFHECCLSVGLACPKPFAVTHNDTCIIKYPDTVVDIVKPNFPPYSVIYPGPTLTTFPQQTLVGSTALLDIRNFLGSQGFHGFGVLLWNLQANLNPAWISVDRLKSTTERSDRARLKFMDNGL